MKAKESTTTTTTTTTSTTTKRQWKCYSDSQTFLRNQSASTSIIYVMSDKSWGQTWLAVSLSHSTLTPASHYKHRSHKARHRTWAVNIMPILNHMDHCRDLNLGFPALKTAAFTARPSRHTHLYARLYLHCWLAGSNLWWEAAAQTILVYSRLCRSTTGSISPLESAIFLCPLLSSSIPLLVAPQCHLSNDVLVFRLIIHPLSATLCF